MKSPPVTFDDGVDALSYLAHAHNHHFSFQQGMLTNINRETQTLQLARICDEQGVNWYHRAN